MANYYCTTRSTYVKVDDIDAYRVAVAEMGFESWLRQDPDHGPLVAFGDSTGEIELHGCTWDEDGDESEWSVADLAPHLVDGWVLTVASVGSEKRRYVSATAVAVSRGHDARWISLASELDMAVRDLGGHTGDYKVVRD